MLQSPPPDGDSSGGFCLKMENLDLKAHFFCKFLLFETLITRELVISEFWKYGLVRNNSGQKLKIEERTKKTIQSVSYTMCTECNTHHQCAREGATR